MNVFLRQVRSERQVDRLVHGEVLVEPGDRERAMRLEARRGEQERLTILELRPRLDQDAESGRIDEAHVAQVDNETFWLL